jgi:hypothetical protein
MISRIPKSFTVGGQDIDVTTIERFEDDKLGACSLWDGRLKIAETYKGLAQSNSSKLNTFNHELIHLILDTMGEYELSANERFVNTFSGFLTEAIRSFKYE